MKEFGGQRQDGQFMRGRGGGGKDETSYAHENTARCSVVVCISHFRLRATCSSRAVRRAPVFPVHVWQPRLLLHVVLRRMHTIDGAIYPPTIGYCQARIDSMRRAKERSSSPRTAGSLELRSARLTFRCGTCNTYQNITVCTPYHRPEYCILSIVLVNVV